MKKTSLYWIYKNSKRYLWRIILLSIICGAIALSYILLALLSSSVLDITTGQQKGNILLQCSLLLGLILGQAILNIVNSNVRVHISGKIEMELKEKLFSALIKKKYLQLSRVHSGEIVNRFTNDIAVVVSGIVSIIPQGISLITKLFGGLIVLSQINWVIAMIIIILGIIYYSASRYFGIKYKKLHKECQESDGNIRAFIQECIENVIVMKSFSNEKPIKQRLTKYQENNFTAKIKRNAMSNLANTLTYVILSLGYFSILAWGAMQIYNGSMTYGNLTALLLIFDQLKAPIRNMSGLVPQYYSMLSSAERIQELEDLPDEVCRVDTENEINQQGGGRYNCEEIYENMECIAFHNITFAYNEKKVIDHTNLVIQKGDMVAVAGTSGVGKSTLIRLLLGFIEPDGGKIVLQTKNKSINIDAKTRELFAYVPQTNMILSGSLHENITLYNPEKSRNEIVEALKTACIWDYIEKLPQQIETIIGERGVGLSEGQIQRLAIARAILSDAPILLLDECTSSLDEITENKVLDNLKALKSKTIICISHKENTIKSCNKVIYMKDGKIMENILYGC